MPSVSFLGFCSMFFFLLHEFLLFYVHNLHKIHEKNASLFIVRMNIWNEKEKSGTF